MTDAPLDPQQVAERIASMRLKVEVEPWTLAA